MTQIRFTGDSSLIVILEDGRIKNREENSNDRQREGSCLSDGST